MNITILGSGNMASFLGNAFHDAGHRIVQVYARTAERGAALAKATGAELVDGLGAIRSDADAYIFAVPDDVLAGLSAAFPCQGKVALHCAGSVATDVLASSSVLHGVIWPLYSIQKNDLPRPTDVPLIVDASDEATRDTVTSLATSISPKVYLLGLEQRKILHLAAVLSNNFVNHLLTISAELVSDLKLPADILTPILRQTLEQTQKDAPASRQTGPAIRHDKATIERHLDLLKPRPEWQEIYRAMTRSIQQFYTDKKK